MLKVFYPEIFLILQILLPELLQWYQADITSQNKPTNSENSSDLLSLISPYLHGDQFKNLPGISSQLSVAVIPHCWRVGYTFMSPESSPQRITTSEYASSTVTRTTGPKYSLTPSLSNYLMARSPLVASLANLSCAQDSTKRSGKQQKDEEPPSLMSSFPASGAHSLEVASPFEYALNQTDQFPVLQRHITSSYYSLLKFFYLDGLGLVKLASSQAAEADNFRLFLLDECTPGVSDVFRQAINYAWCKEGLGTIYGYF